MTVFSNQRQLDLVSQFASFIDLVINPEKFSALVVESQKIRDELKQYVEAKTQLDKIDDYVTAADEDLAAKKMVLEREREAVEKYEEKVKRALAERELAVEVSEQAVRVRLEKSDNKEAELNEKEKALGLLKKELESKQALLERTKEELDAQAVALKEKADKLKALLG